RLADERKATSRCPSSATSWVVISEPERSTALRADGRSPVHGGPPTMRVMKRPVCMLTHSYYEEDPRVRREAEALVAAGRPVEVFGLRRPDDPAEGELEGVTLHRLDTQRHQGAGLATYASEYLSFFARAAMAATSAHSRARF